MANFQFTGNRLSFSRGLCCCGECARCPHTREQTCTCPSDGVGGQQGLTDQAVLQALVTQYLQLRPDTSKG